MNINLGIKLFQFNSKIDWVIHANSAWQRHGVRPDHTICIDQRGRICRIGMHFSAAEKDNAYPIDVYLIRAEEASAK